MNEDQSQNDDFLDQLNQLLESGSPHDDAFVNMLAHTVPKADRLFQQELEQTLLVQPQTQQALKVQEEHSMSMLLAARRVHPISIAPFTWAVTLVVVAIAVGSVILVNLNRVIPLTGTPSAALQVNQPVSLLIATQEIEAGTLITDTMVGVVTLSKADVDKLSMTQPTYEILSDIQLVVGQKAAVTIHWFQPFETNLLGEPVNLCVTPCLDVPKDYLTVGFPLQADTLQGLKIGDRVDVLAEVDGEIRVITANVMLTNIESDIVTFATPKWQSGVLLWLYHSGESYALRLHTGAVPEPLDNNPAEVVITAPQALPQDFMFDLMVNVPASKGYLLTDLPATIDAIAFTTNGDTLYFRFKNLEVVSVKNGTAVTIRLPRADAANLDYLIGLQAATLSFVPAEGTP